MSTPEMYLLPNDEEAMLAPPAPAAPSQPIEEFSFSNPPPDEE